MMQYKKISFINFSDLTLNFKSNYYNTINFNYKNVDYALQIIKLDDKFYLKQSGKCCVAVVVNKKLKHSDFDFMFCTLDFKQFENDLNENTLFSKYVMGILTND